MKAGSLVRHKYGTLQGTGIVLSIRPFDGREVRALWTSHGLTQVHELSTRYLEVIGNV